MISNIEHTEPLSADKSIVKKLLLKSLSQKGDPVDDLVISATPCHSLNYS